MKKNKKIFTMCETINNFYFIEAKNKKEAQKIFENESLEPNDTQLVETEIIDD